MPHRWSIAMILFGIAALASPRAEAAPCEAHEIGFGVAAPEALRAGVSHAELVNAIASVIRDTLGLPFAKAHKAYICGDEAAFTEELFRNFGVSAVSGDWRIVPSAAGIATRIGVFLRGDYLSRANLHTRVTVVAHELAHLSQQELAGSRESRLPVWMLEGHADWVAYQVLHRLRLRTYGESRAIVGRSVAGAVTPVEHFPDLDALAAHATWNRSVRSLPATYGQAFLAVEFLIDRSSHSALMKFLGSAVADDFRERWAEAFSTSYSQFAEDFRAYLKTVGRPATGLTIDPMPRP
jgi:hypothetical protein